MNPTTFKFKVQALRTLVSPYKSDAKDGNEYETIYYLLVDMMELPSNIPLDVNPREPKMTTNVAKRLKAAVIEPETDFYINNRGIVISARSLKFDPATSVVEIDLGDQDNLFDKYTYGILDGGHTYTAIMQSRDAIPDDLQKYVRLEVITNVSNITRLSDARNTSVQVSDIALFNLDDKFDLVKEVVANEDYGNKIAYKDNEDKPIYVAELLRLMYAVDIDRYPDDSAAPVQSYSGKALVFKRFREACDTPFYKALTRELPTLVALYDAIETGLPEAYKQYKIEDGIKFPKFGGVKGVEPIENGRSFFFGNRMSHNISVGYIFPIFGAFRSIIHFDSEKESIWWTYSPLDMWKQCCIALARNTFDSENNPQLAGKNKNLWLTNYRIVETQALRNLLQTRS